MQIADRHRSLNYHTHLRCSLEFAKLLAAEPEWRNWQTRMVQVHVPVKGVEVQILSRVL